jgi:enoyl-CoA hydratase
MTSSTLALTIDNAVAHIVLNRPEALNALPRPFWNEFPALVRDIDDNAKARAIVLSSTGKHFTAGLDTSALSEHNDKQGDAHTRAEAFRHHIMLMQAAVSSVEEARMPVIAAIQGGCVGAGVDLISACDIRYATEDAFFVIQEINLAITADVGTFPRLCKLIPEGWVREMAYAGRRLPAAKAKEIGLVNDVFPTQEAMLAHVMELAREIAEKSPLAVYGSKRMINYARDHTIADALDYVATWQASMFPPEHIAEALTAKAQKRTPVFPDLKPLKKQM